MKVEIDQEVLASLSQSLLQAAGLLQQAIKPPELAAPKVAKKRGRPKKFVPTVEQLAPEAAPAEEYTDILEVLKTEAPLPEQRKPNPNIVMAKRAGWQMPSTEGSKTYGHTEKVVKQNGDQKFVDLTSVGDRIPAYKYPQPTERRPAAQKVEFKCDFCNKVWQDYPATCPQAFMKEVITGVGEGRPRVICDDCIGK